MSNKRGRQRAAAEAPRDRGPENAVDDEHIHDREQRFAWLLAPIRDLSQNWNIDITQELEKYLTELGHVVIAMDASVVAPRGPKMNFAEAALLIQGTTSIYSKKVEYLYQLCFELVQTLARQRAARDVQPTQNPSVDERGKDRDTSSLMRRHVEFDDDFLALDDLRECRDLDLHEKENAAARTGLVRPPMPLSLVPLEEFEKSPLPLINAAGQVFGRRDDFWMNTGKIFPANGTLLLDAGNARLTNAPLNADTFAPRIVNQSLVGLNIETVSPIAGVREMPSQISPDAPQGAQVQVPNAETTFGPPADASFNNDDVGHDDSIPNFDPAMDTSEAVADPPPPPPPTLRQSQRLKRFGLSTGAENAKKKRKTQKEIMAEIRTNPWEEFNSDDEGDVNAKKSFKKGKTYRDPTIGVPPPGQDGKNADVCAPQQSVSDFLNSCYQNRRGKLPKEAWKRPNCPALHETFWKERKNRTKIQAQRRLEQKGDANDDSALFDNAQAGQGRQAETEEEVEARELNLSIQIHMFYGDGDGNEGQGDDDNDGDDNNDGQGAGDQPAEANDESDGEVEFHGFDAMEYENPDNAAGPSAAPITYEELARQRLDKILKDAEANVALGDLHRRVQEWETKIEPALRADENRRRFDIHEYGDDLLSFFDTDAGLGTSANNTNDNGFSYDFEKFAATKPRWEVCRYFLSTLMLANTGNVELSTRGDEGTSECINTLNLTLITRQRHHEQLEEYAAPSALDK